MLMKKGETRPNRLANECGFQCAASSLAILDQDSDYGIMRLKVYRSDSVKSYGKSGIGYYVQASQLNREF